MRTGICLQVRDYGAKGNGQTLDGRAINSAIQKAFERGGGLVVVGPGRYLSFSIQLRSRVTLVLERGATLVAATPEDGLGAYDLPEERGPQRFQDFGHSHWHNSLIWADGAEDIAIIGEGLIDGVGLTRDGPGTPWSQQGERPLSMAGMSQDEIKQLEPSRVQMRGLGNKAIALVNCKRVHLESFSVFRGGHFAVLATGVEDLTVRDLTIDTNRDGIDLDCVSRARIESCRVNTPNDDAIVLKTSLALGSRRTCEEIAIRGCTVSGFDLGSLLDGSRSRTQQLAPDRDRVTGRIKIGTESNGDFRRISIKDCRFERSRGLAIQTVDGGNVEEIDVENIEMDEVTTSPLFFRAGARLRDPETAAPGAIRNVQVRSLHARGIDPRFAAIVSGLPEQPIEGLMLRDVHLEFEGDFGEQVPEGHAELPTAYPEPSMFGPTPSWGFWARHTRGLDVAGLRLSRKGRDARLPLCLLDVDAPIDAEVITTAATV